MCLLVPELHPDEEPAEKDNYYLFVSKVFYNKMSCIRYIIFNNYSDMRRNWSMKDFEPGLSNHRFSAPFIAYLGVCSVFTGMFLG